VNDILDAVRAWLQLLRIAGGLKKSMDARLRGRFGVSISRFDVMSALERAGADGLRAGELSQRLRVTEGNTTQVTAPLIRDGLVKRITDREDARVAIFKLTKKGETLFAEMAEEHRRWVAEAFSGLSSAQIDSMRKLLDKIAIPADAANSGKDAA